MTKEITALEADLRKEREESRKTGKRGNEGAALGLGEDEDWTVNERGEVRYLTGPLLILFMYRR